MDSKDDTNELIFKKWHRDLQDGGGLRLGDHLQTHKYHQTLLQNTFWTLAEDARLPKREANHLRMRQGKR